MEIREVMSRDVQIASPDDTIRQAAAKMKEIDAGVLPVAEGDKLVGMLTDRDIAVRAVAEGKGPDAKVRDIMTPEVKYVFDDEEIEDVAENMAAIQVRRLPVVNERSAWSALSLSATWPPKDRSRRAPVRCTASRSLAVSTAKAVLARMRAISRSPRSKNIFRPRGDCESRNVTAMRGSARPIKKISPTYGRRERNEFVGRALRVQGPVLLKRASRHRFERGCTPRHRPTDSIRIDTS
jgi:CBS domain-containing protein